MSEIRCPACEKLLASVKAIPSHVYRCPRWEAVIQTHPSKFNFAKFYKRDLYEESLVENVDYVSCQLCVLAGEEFRVRRLIQHLNQVHGCTDLEYESRFPGFLVRLQSTNEIRKATVREIYGVDYIAQVEEVKSKGRQTSLAKYGIEHAGSTPEAKAKAAATNLERYGHENPFGSKEIQAKVRQAMVETYGFENPQQVPEIKARTEKTNLERYGETHYLLTEEGKAKARETSIVNWGTEHPMQSVEDKKLCEDVMMAKFGVPNPLMDPEIQRKAYETNLRNHGGIHSQQVPEVREKARQTWVETLGVDNPSKSPEVWKKTFETWTVNYGQPFPPRSLTQTAPTKPELLLGSLSPENVVYTGMSNYCIGNRARHPDFVVLSEKQLEEYKSGESILNLRTSAIVEMFGRYPHGPKVTGLPHQVHKRERLYEYAQAGVACLVVWDNEVYEQPELVRSKVVEFIERWKNGYYLDIKTDPLLVDELVEDLVPFEGISDQR